MMRNSAAETVRAMITSWSTSAIGKARRVPDDRLGELVWAMKQVAALAEIELREARSDIERIQMQSKLARQSREQLSSITRDRRSRGSRLRGDFL